MELTNELKARYYGLHIGETVLCDSKEWVLRGVILVGNDTPTLTLQNKYKKYVDYECDLCILLLRPLSSMTEKEKNHLASLDRISGADYIRSIGVLISFMGISSDRWISSGVVKLKES